MHFSETGSVFEVSISHRRRKMIEQQLACPTFSMFDKIEKSVHASLQHHLDRFYTTTYFSNIPETIREEQLKAREKMKKLMRRQSCIGFGGITNMFQSSAPNHKQFRMFVAAKTNNIMICCFNQSLNSRHNLEFNSLYIISIF